MDAALGPDDSAAVAWENTDDQGVPDVAVTVLEDGTWQAPHELGPGEVGDVVIDPAGDLTVAWTAPEDWDQSVMVVRRVDGEWEKPQKLGGGSEPELAVNSHGDLAVVWATRRGVRVSVRRHSTGNWAGASSIVGVPYPEDPHVGIDDRGRALAMWSRGTNEDVPARRHLSWTQTTDGQTWTPARYLDTRTGPDIDGETMGLSMNPRGQAVAAWAPDSDQFRAASFTFATGWTVPQEPADYAFRPTVLMTRSGAEIVVTGGPTAPEWIHRQPGEQWTPGDRINRQGILAGHGHGQRMAVLFRIHGTLMARVLNAPTRSSMTSHSNSTLASPARWAPGDAPR